jgi:hypothetical protein
MATVASGISGAEGPFAQRGHTGPLMASGKKVADVGLEWPYTTKESKMNVDEMFEELMSERLAPGKGDRVSLSDDPSVKGTVRSTDPSSAKVDWDDPDRAKKALKGGQYGRTDFPLIKKESLGETTTSGNATTLAVPVGAVVRRQVVSLDDVVRALGIGPDAPPELIGGFVNLPDYIALGGFDIEGPDGQSQWWLKEPSSPERWKTFQNRK